MTDRKLAVVTGASTGIGYELARYAVEQRHDLLIVADEAQIEAAADKLRRLGGTVQALQADLATPDGVDALWAAIGDQPVDVLCANAGRALGQAFHDQDWLGIERLIALNLVQTTLTLHRAGLHMKARGRGRILVTGSIGGFVAGPYDAVYNATKGYLNSLCYALRDEWQDSGVSITCLMPGPVDTPIFHREGNDLADTPIAASNSKSDPAEVARHGWDAMMAGKAGTVPGFAAKLITMLSGVVPQNLLSKLHALQARPQ